MCVTLRDDKNLLSNVFDDWKYADCVGLLYCIVAAMICAQVCTVQNVYIMVVWGV